MKIGGERYSFLFPLLPIGHDHTSQHYHAIYKYTVFISTLLRITHVFTFRLIDPLPISIPYLAATL